jgi:hypothetical protein
VTRISLALLVAVAAAACTSQTLKVAPVQVEPIHVVIDVNLHDLPATPAATAPKR